MENVFKCSYCGKEFDSPVERAKCELACAAKMKEEEEKIHKEKINKEKDARYTEIQSEYKKIKEMVSAYVEDYGTFSFHSYSENFPIVSSLFDKWWF